jgi:hypothetical protein
VSLLLPCISTDAENVMKSMKASFNSIGSTLTLSPLEQHAQRVERYMQPFNSGVRSTLDSLYYELLFMVYLHIAMNYVPNSRSFPFTPHKKVFQARKQFYITHLFLPFGKFCMVGIGDDKKKSKAFIRQHHVQAMAKSDIGVCMGSYPAFPGSFLFYVDSNNAPGSNKNVAITPMYGPASTAPVRQHVRGCLSPPLPQQHNRHQQTLRTTQGVPQTILSEWYASAANNVTLCSA